MLKTVKVMFLVLAIAAVLYIAWYFHLNASYVADMAACRVENADCIESEAWSGKANYDSMDGLYYIHELYTDNGTVKLKDFCLVREAEQYSAKCEDSYGKFWNITLGELKW